MGRWPRPLELYDTADGKAEPSDDDPTVVICMDEFGPLNLQPPRQAVGRGGGAASTPTWAGRPGAVAPQPTSLPTACATLLAACDLSTDRLYGHVKTKKGRTEFLTFCR